jgi:hypothetical protein
MRTADARVGRRVAWERGGHHTGILAHIEGRYGWVSLPAPAYQARVALAQLAPIHHIRGGRRG